MPIIQPYRQHTPVIAEDVFIADNATIIGEVIIGKGSSIWYNAVVRGDVGLIQIGEDTNIQDGVIIHCTTDRSQTIIGNEVVIGHGAILHGCELADQCMIGMGAIVLDLTTVPTHTIIAAGALVPEGKKLEPGYIYAGVPAKALKPVSELQIEEIQTIVQRYVTKSRWYKQTQVL